MSNATGAGQPDDGTTVGHGAFAPSDDPPVGAHEPLVTHDAHSSEA